MDLVIHDKSFNTDIEKLKNISNFFSQRSTKEGNHVVFNYVSTHKLLNKFFLLIEGKKVNIIDDEWLEIVDIAIEWKCNKTFIDLLYSNVIIQLNNCDDKFIDKSAEKLPELIKYISFTLLPISTISKLFESRFTCLPSQIEITNFVIRFFDIVGISAISFVHYIDPKYLPPSHLDKLNKKIAEFNCSYLFPEYQIFIPKSRDIKEITLQFEIAKSKKEKSITELQSLNEDGKNADQKLQELMSDFNSKKIEKGKMVKKFESIKSECEKENQILEKLANLSNSLQKKKSELQEKEKELEKYEEEVENNKKEIRKYDTEIKKYFGENALYHQMEEDLNLLQKECDKNAKYIEHDEKLIESIQSNSK